ncbi:MAG: winged helix-turn-helix transcriptional regulator [Candidatus Heimdallarchaeota archaeon]|nr:MAG: winged helix-turn-helix transcriptional regulator [Candidatus Heimdallarchaeota archaeon]
MSTSHISKILELFDNPTISQISMYLVFYSELTAGQLAKITKKNLSTITRNLEKLLEANLVYVSKTEAKGNLQVKYWALNPEIISLDTLITDETIDQLSGEEKEKAIFRMQNILIAFREILKTVYDHLVNSQLQYFQNPSIKEDSNIFTIFLFSTETGHLFVKEFIKFQRKFFEEHREPPAGIDSINLNSVITFMLSSRLGDIFPPIQ